MDGDSASRSVYSKASHLLSPAVQDTSPRPGSAFSHLALSRGAGSSVLLGPQSVPGTPSRRSSSSIASSSGYPIHTRPSSSRFQSPSRSVSPLIAGSGSRVRPNTPNESRPHHNRNDRQGPSYTSTGPSGRADTAVPAYLSSRSSSTSSLAPSKSNTGTPHTWLGKLASTASLQSETLRSRLGYSPSSPYVPDATRAPGANNTPSYQFGSQPDHDEEGTFDDDGLNEVIMGLDVNKDGRVGCSYYVAIDETLFIEEDIPMGGIEAVGTLLLQAQPTTILIPNRAPDELVQFLELDAQRYDDGESTSEMRGSYILRYLAGAEFDCDSGKEALVSLDLDGPKQDTLKVISPDDDSLDCISSANNSKLVRMAENIDLGSHLSIGCAGAVLGDLDRRMTTEGAVPDAEGYVRFRVRQIRMNRPLDTMVINADALVSLQILQSDLHPNPQSQQPWNTSEAKAKESLSIAGLLQAQACTAEGKSNLRRLLFRPSTNLGLLEQRHNVLGILLRPDNREKVKGIRKQLKKIKNIKTLLLHVQAGVDRIRGRLSLRTGDWLGLMRFAMVAAQLKEDILTLSGTAGVEVLYRISHDIDIQSLLNIGQTIMETIDFKLSKESGHTEIQKGASAKLDELKSAFATVYRMLPDVRASVLREIPRWAAKHVHHVITLPLQGFLIATDLDPETREGVYSGQGSEDAGWQMVFCSGNHAYYKNRSMTSLDDQYGDLQSDIADEEIEVVMELAAAVVSHKNAITDASTSLGELDALLALASAAEKYKWGAPRMTLANVINIENGRHPLQEFLTSSFIPNNCQIRGGPGSCGPKDDYSFIFSEMNITKPSMLILTGPNNSGKSIYMKQVAIIVYLAHIGSYVPASSATIGLTDRILTRISTRETVMDDESAFLIDLKQAAFSVNFATRRSLLLIDEFGKGTTAEMGAAILASYLSHFLDLGVDQPKVLVGTHFHDVLKSGFLEPGDGVAFAHMGVRLDPEAQEVEDQITYLFQLFPGRAESSLGVLCAAANGVEREVVERAEYILQLLNKNENVAEALSTLNEDDVKKLKQAELVGRRFLATTFPKPGGDMSARDIIERLLSAQPDEEETGM